jgi:ribonuclease D
MSAPYVDEPAGLDALCRELGRAPWVALDTEFRRVDTYYAQLCLIQLATPALITSVDPLAVDPAPLLDALARAGLLKVLHAARQDLEVLHDLGRRMPRPVFDTQIAAALCGYPDQVGYAGLVETLTGERLDKSQTRTDWTRRPLTPAQLAYAADDVRHLRTVYAALEQRLRDLGRRAWLEEECEALTDPALYSNEPANAWRRIGAATTLAPAERAALVALAAWRERTAQTLNRPRGWILADAPLVELARRRPRTAAALAAIEGMSPAVVRKRAEEILEALREAEGAPAPGPGAPARLTPQQQALARELAAHVARVAAELNIAPSLIAARQDLQALASGERAVRVLRGWRLAVAGRELERMLDDRAGVASG